MELHQRIVSAPVDFGAVRTEFGLASDYPSEAVSEARDAVDAFAGSRVDRRDIPLVTIDPPGAMDLDQALSLERTDTGFLLHYAIADVAAVVRPDGPLAATAMARGQTFYLPDGTVPLHPNVLSEGTASLLPDQDRPAALWTIELDEKAEPLRYSVTRALVRSRARLDYTGVQADADAGRLHPAIAALPEFGRLRIEAGLERGAISLRLPTQSVVPDGREQTGVDHWQLIVEPRTAADDWNEQVSLLTGMCAAAIMLNGYRQPASNSHAQRPDSAVAAQPGAGRPGADSAAVAGDSAPRIGLLRTMPPPPASAIASMRRTAAAVGVDWPAGEPVGRMLAGLDPNTPAALVLMSEATGLLRGASYTLLNGQPPETVQHSGIGAPYAHVTAPLRRLSDRFATEICLSHCAGTRVPQWVHDGLAAAADSMRRSDAVAGKLERACIDLTESTLLAQRVGTDFDAVVLREANGTRPAEIFVADPPVLAKCEGAPLEGRRVKVRLTVADPLTRTVTFAYQP
ncbi:RNB domain-containing ribonuclease [Nocardia sp. 2]|uniref:RNB domain-containing ribonuclease n=1 Tax=Nocardia acididurans TaxID=2802282 RepID=A0ABS1M2K3_9NOCA|nr:RNB domain-containing ribonuclease [Nocardia acididurans]MBL1074410.1 RNB domain-containing ribonuclease [Nocardia acididurans]